MYHSHSSQGGYVYILASRRNGTLYVGATDDLARRILEHKAKVLPGFTKDYNVTMLVYFEMTETLEGAYIREKRMKDWKRSWKIRQIEEMNPEWRDLTEVVVQDTWEGKL